MKIIKIDAVTHIGEIDIAKKSKGSYEGPGLSVSVHPGAWSHIAEIGTDGFILRKKELPLEFADALRLTKSEMTKINQWALENELLVYSEVFEVSYFAEDTETRRSFECQSREEAESEIEDMLRPRIKGPLLKLKATQKLLDISYCRDTPERISSALAFDYALIAYAEANLAVDGVWWEEELDAYELSAPRGVLFNQKLEHLEKIETSFETYDLEDEFVLEQHEEYGQGRNGPQ